jgi:O-antigen/teichoic acid export membrane protein
VRWKRRVPGEIFNMTAQKSIAGKLISGSIYNYCGQIYIMALTIAAIPFIVHRLGAELYGVVALVQTISGLSGFVNLGIGRALTKYVAELYCKNEAERISRLFQTAWFTSIVSGTIAMMALVLPGKLIGTTLLKGVSESKINYEFAMIAAAIGLLLSLLNEAVASIPNACQRFDVLNIINITSCTFRYMGSVVAVRFGGSAREVLIINIAASLLSVSLMGICNKKLIPGLSYIPRFDWSSFKKLFAFSAPLLLSGISATVLARLDRIILAYYLPIIAISYYSLPYSLVERVSGGVGNITSVVFPFASELSAKNTWEKIRDLYLRSMRIMMLATLPIIICITMLANDILTQWLGPEFALNGRRVMIILGFASLVNAASAVPTVLCQGVGKPWLPAKYSIITSVLNVMANLILIPKYGIEGAAFGLLLPQLLLVPLFVVETNRLIGVSAREIIVQAYGRPILCSISMCVVIPIIQAYAKNLVMLFVVCLTAITIYLINGYGIGLRREERSALNEQIFKGMVAVTRLNPRKIWQ